MEKKKEVVQGCGDSSHMFLSLLPWAGGKPEALTAHVFLALGMCSVRHWLSASLVVDLLFLFLVRRGGKDCLVFMILPSSQSALFSELEFYSIMEIF